MANKGGYGIARKGNLNRSTRTLQTASPAALKPNLTAQRTTKLATRSVNKQPKTGGYIINETTGQRRRNTK